MNYNREDLITDLRAADAAYYGDGTSPLTDKEYDEKKAWLKSNFPEETYLDEVGAEPIENTHWEKHKHEYPLGSLDKVNSYSELIGWKPQFPVVVQQKLDGISICLTYEDGKLTRAVTRGKNGVGDNITRNVIKMKGIVTELPAGFEDTKAVVRGEIVLKHSDFEKLPIEKRGKNPRNTAAGAAKKLSGDLCSHLTIIVYDLMNAADLGVITETISNTYLKSLGFPFIVDTNRCNNEDELDECIGVMEGNRDVYDYDIDGLVIKNNQIDSKDNWEHPKNKIAYKFSHQLAMTTIKEIVWSTSGERVNPVAILEPVDIAGVTVSKASLHNKAYIEQLANGNPIRRGDWVEVTRRNDVIPQVERITERSQGLVLKMIPSSCPTCDGDIERPFNSEGKEMAWYICTNPACSAKAIKNVLKWFEVHDCKGVAEKTVELIHNEIGFDNLAEFIDIINNKEEDLLKLSGMGKSKLKTIRDQLKSTKDTSISKFIGGLNFRGFGPKSIQKIVSHVTNNSDTSISEVLNINFEELVKVEGFSDSSASSYLSQVDNSRVLMAEIEKRGVRPSIARRTTATSAPLTGTSFCFTGAMNTMNRKEAQELVESLGGEFRGSVSKGLSYLVTNTPDNGSSKNKKATQLEVKIITEEEFKSLLAPIALLKSL